MNVNVLCEHPRGRAAVARLRRRARAVLAALRREGAELSILLVGDRGMRRLNRAWRGKDVPTDVLSFPAAESAAPLLGDVAISVDTAARVARAERRPIADELDRYLVHGILHLLGFDHEEPSGARRMAREEGRLLDHGHGLVAAATATPEPREPAPAKPRERAAAPGPRKRPAVPKRASKPPPAAAGRRAGSRAPAKRSPGRA